MALAARIASSPHTTVTEARAQEVTPHSGRDTISASASVLLVSPLVATLMPAQAPSAHPHWLLVPRLGQLRQVVSEEGWEVTAGVVSIPLERRRA
jgi:hypothetical protein